MAESRAEPGTGQLTPRQIVTAMSGLVLAMLLAMLDNMIVAPALPTIVGELGGLNHLSWVVTAYILASTVATPIWGKLGDIFGHKHIFMASIVLFLIGSALCGASQNMTELVAVPRRAGPRRRRPDRRHHVGDRDARPAARTRQVHGRDDGGDAGRDDRRAADRRLHHRQRLVALGLLRQPAARHRLAVRGLVDAAPLPRAVAPGQGAHRLVGRRRAQRLDHLAGAGHHLGRPPVPVGLVADPGPVRGGRGRPRRLPA